MALAYSELMEIYATTLSFQEKLGISNKLLIKDKNSHDAFLQMWKATIAETNNIYFQTRLKWSDLDDEKVRFLLSEVNLKHNIKIETQDWLIFLKDFDENIGKFTSHKDVRFVGKMESEPVPFEDLLKPIVFLCFNRLGKSVSMRLLSESAQSDLRKILLNELCQVSSQTFLSEFQDYQDKTGNGYADFIKYILRQKFRGIFKRFPLLAKFVCVTCVNWLRNSKLLIQRFYADQKDLFNLMVMTDEEKCLIEEIVGGLSDKHLKGQTVFILRLTNNRKIVYKPRDLTTDKAFFDFTSWLNNILGKPVFKTIKVLNKNKEYGWIEYVFPKTCESQKDVELYFYNLGCLLCVLHLIGATDVHKENIIVNGIYPVAIDLETIFTPRIKPNRPLLNQLNELIERWFGNSVSRVGVLPHWLLGPDGEVYDNSALGGFQPQIAPYPIQEWQHINQDDMFFEYKPYIEKLDLNIVYLYKKVIEPYKFDKEVINGFRDIYKLILTHKTDVAHNLLGFKKAKIRFVFRATKVYSLLLQYLYHPEFMKGGIERSINLDVLSKGMTVYLDKKYKYWRILDHEYEALNIGDIPYFYTFPKSVHLYSNDGRIFKNCFEQSGYDDCIDRLQKFTAEDLELQLSIIEKSISTTRLSHDLTRQSHNISIASSMDRKNDEVLELVEEIGAQLINSAIESSDNRCTWVSYVSNVISHTFGYKPVGLDLCNGNMGISLFLASLYAVTKKEKYKEFCYKALNPVIDILKHEWSKKEFSSQFGVGGTTGLGSIIYGFSKIAMILENEELFQVAFDFSESISEELVYKSIRSDVVSGSAGCMLALIYLYTEKPKESLLTKIQLCANHLLKSRKLNHLGQYTWEFQNDKFLLGFSHGSSGILFALSKLANIFPSKNLSNAIREILEYENSEYSKRDNNWPDYRFEKVNMNAVGWCHGATGVGLSRLELFRRNSFSNHVKIDLSRALKKTVEEGFGYIDTLCCGNMGRTDLLLSLAIIKNDNELMGYCNDMISLLLKRYRKNGKFNCFTHFETTDINAGLYQGVSGIGYQLLRLYAPEKFGSILLFE